MYRLGNWRKKPAAPYKLKTVSIALEQGQLSSLRRLLLGALVLIRDEFTWATSVYGEEKRCERTSLVNTLYKVTLVAETSQMKDEFNVNVCSIGKK